ncbi:MAG: MATE family efflux transporter [Succinatimonas sp.]|nr:MATE family efflux transporter [Succinatimonas sp.]
MLKKFSGGMDMLHGRLWDKILFFSLQLALTSLLQQIYNTTDVLVLGRFLGDDAMAAVGNNLPIIGILVSLFVGLSLGANVVMARYIGQGDLKNANLTIYTSLLLAFFSGLIIAVPVILGAAVITDLMGVPPSVHAFSVNYLIWYMAGMPFLSIFNFEAALFRAHGNTATPLLALIAASAVNVALDLAAVKCGLGISGVAAATSAANLFSAVFLFVKLKNENGVLKLDVKKLCHFEIRKAKAVIFIGLPAGVQAMVFSISNLVIQGAINSLGAEVMAASAAALVFELNIYVFLMAFGMAATTFVSQNYGAGNMQRCSQVVHSAMALNFAVTIFWALVVWFAGDRLIWLFTDSKTVADLALVRMYTVILLYVICVPFEVLSGAMRGFGYSLPPALVTTFFIVGERMLWLITVFKAHPDFQCLLITYPVSWILVSPFIMWLYLRCVKKRNRELEALAMQTKTNEARKLKLKQA